MIGLRPHPSDPSRYIYVALVYSAESGAWHPARDALHDDEVQAVVACAEEIDLLLDEVNVNMKRLASRVCGDEVIVMDGVLFTPDPVTGVITEVGETGAGGEKRSADEVYPERVLADLAWAREVTGTEVTALGLRRAMALLGALVNHRERAREAKAEQKPLGPSTPEPDDKPEDAEKPGDEEKPEGEDKPEDKEDME